MPTDWVAAIAFSLVLHGLLALVLTQAMSSRDATPVRMRLDVWLGELAAPSALLAENGRQTSPPRSEDVVPQPASVPRALPARDAGKRVAPLPVVADIDAPQASATSTAMDVPAPRGIAANDPVSDAEPLSAEPVRSIEATPPTASDASSVSVQLHLLDWLREHRVYPRAARRSGVQGRVELRFTIDRAGVVSGLQIATSSGHAVLDRAAERLVRDASPFASMPPMSADRVDVTLPVDYSLDDALARGRP